MKKILIVGLVLMMVLTSSMVSFADGWKVPPGQAKKAERFNDLSGFSWAKDAIERMAERGIVVGIGEGLFAPNKSVTKLEAIVMALRVMGDEEESKLLLNEIKIGKKDFKYKDYIQSWGWGYVIKAIQKGILDETDIVNLKLNTPAKRYEVAKYIIRAVGLEEQAKDNMDKKLNFKDAKEIPKNAIGYVYLANKIGIINGYTDGRIKPNKPVTRVEMAVMIARLDEKLDDYFDDEDDEDEDEEGEEDEEELVDVVGTMLKMDSKSLTIKNKFQVEIRYLFANTVKLEFKSGEGTLEDIKVNDKLKLTLNDNLRITKIYVDKEIEEKEIIEGSVAKIDNNSLTVRNRYGVETRYLYLSTVEVEFKAGEGTLEDIKLNDKVKVTLNDNQRIMHIYVDKELEEKEIVEGSVAKIDSNSLTVRNRYGVETRYLYLSTVEVEFKAGEGTLEDIKLNDKVKVTLNDNQRIVHIYVDKELEDKYIVEGTVEKIDNSSLTVKDKYGVETRYYFNQVLGISFKGGEGTLEDIEVNDKVKLTLNESYKIVKIYVDKVVVIYEGKVYSINDTTIQILVNNSVIRKNLAEDLTINFNNGEGTIKNIVKDDKIKAKLNSEGKVKEINVDKDIVKYEGIFKGITDDKLTLHVNNDVEMRFPINEEVIVIIDEETEELEDIDLNAEIEIILDDESRIVKITVIK